MSLEPQSRPLPVPPRSGGDVFQRQMKFWLIAFAAIVLVLWLLSEILLPFIVGLAIAYLLTPFVDRLERAGANRLAASLLIISIVVLLFVLVILLVAPVLGGQLASFIDNIPLYVTKLRALVTDPSRPWVQKLVGAGINFNTDKGISDLVTQGVGYLTSFLKSLWSGGRALVSLFSLMVVTPVVAFYLIYDWHRMIAAVDSWIPVNQRDTVRGAGARDRRRHRRLRARAGGGVPDPGLVLRRGADHERAQLRPADRPDLRADHVHSLCRLDDRPGAGARRRRGAVLAGLLFDPHSSSASSSSDSSSRATCCRPSWSAKASGCIRSG